MSSGRLFADNMGWQLSVSGCNWLALGITMAILGYIAACGLCLIMQGRFSVLESGLRVFKIIVFKELMFF